MPDFAAFQQTRRGRSTFPPTPSRHRQYWFKDDHEPAGEERPAVGPRTDSVRLLEDGHIAELAILLGGSGEDPGHEGSDRACGTTQPTARGTVDVGRPLRDPLGQVPQPLSGTESGAEFSWLLVGTHSPALQPLVDAITARGQRHRFVDLPTSDADETALAEALRTAAADGPALRILNVGALESDAHRRRNRCCGFNIES